MPSPRERDVARTKRGAIDGVDLAVGATLSAATTVG